MTRDEFLDLALKQKTIVGLQLADIDLSQENLKDITFKRCSLTRINFELSNLSGARFEQCQLYALTWNLANLTGARFEKSFLRHLIAYYTDLADVVITEDCKIIEPVRIWNCHLTGARFDSKIFSTHSGYIRNPEALRTIKQARKNRLAELKEAQRLADVEAQKEAERIELADLAKLPMSELLRRFSDDLSNTKIAQILDSKFS